jgi:hypothetical protein
MNIAMIHFRVGATDGVSLEMDKWRYILKRLGHNVSYIAAESHGTDAYIIPEMSITSAEHKKLFHNCYEALTDYAHEDDLLSDIIHLRDIIYKKLLSYILEERIDLIIPNNVSSLGLHLPTGLAISKLIQTTSLHVIYHHHDFYFERERYNHPTASFIQQMLEHDFPYHNERCQHVVINRLAQHELNIRRDLNAYVIPNVFDFNRLPWKDDEQSEKLKSFCHIHDGDITLLQATRIEDRKAIELALDVTEELYRRKDELINKTLYNHQKFNQRSQIHFIMAGLNEMKPSLYEKLSAKIASMPYRIHIISDDIGSEHQLSDKPYTLWDTYKIADVITYPSILEGWGNQLLEGVFAKKPMVIYEYPVYVSDLKPIGFDFISLGSHYMKNDQGLITVDSSIIKKVCDELIETLTSPRKYQKTIETNFEIAKKHFSYEALETHIKHIISNI